MPDKRMEAEVQSRLEPGERLVSTCTAYRQGAVARVAYAVCFALAVMLVAYALDLPRLLSVGLALGFAWVAGRVVPLPAMPDASTLAGKVPSTVQVVLAFTDRRLVVRGTGRRRLDGSGTWFLPAALERVTVDRLRFGGAKLTMRFVDGSSVLLDVMSDDDLQSLEPVLNVYRDAPLAAAL
jgi:hypothetical protein